MSDPRFEEFKELLLAYTKPVEDMEAAHHCGTRAQWEDAAQREAEARLALYDWASRALSSPPAPAEGEREGRWRGLREALAIVVDTRRAWIGREREAALVRDVLTGVEERIRPMIPADAPSPRPPSSPDPTRCPPGCKGIHLGGDDWSGCSCGTGKLANGQPCPPGFKCDCPQHGAAPSPDPGERPAYGACPEGCGHSTLAHAPGWAHRSGLPGCSHLGCGCRWCPPAPSPAAAPPPGDGPCQHPPPYYLFPPGTLYAGRNQCKACGLLLPPAPQPEKKEGT